VRNLMAFSLIALMKFYSCITHFCWTKGWFSARY